MRSLSVYFGGKKICVAGLDNGSVSAEIAVMSGLPKEWCYLSVGGLDSRTQEHLTWCRQKLKAGDEIRIVLEDTAHCDEPKGRKSVKEVERWARDLGQEVLPKDSSDKELQPLPAPVVLEVLERLDPNDRKVIEQLMRSIRKRADDSSREGLDKEE